MKILTLLQTIELAQKAANDTKKNQVIFTTIEQGHEVYKFTEEKNFTGTAIRVIRYAGENNDTDVLLDSGNGQPEPIVSDTGKSKTGKRNPAKRDLEQSS